MGRKGRKQVQKNAGVADDEVEHQDAVDDEQADGAGEQQDHHEHQQEEATADRIPSPHPEATPDNIEQQLDGAVGCGGNNNTTSPGPLTRMRPSDDDLAEADATATSTLEGTDGGDTREGSAGNPHFSNAVTEDLPLASPYREAHHLPPPANQEGYQEITVGSMSFDNSNGDNPDPALALSEHVMSPMSGDLQADSTRVVEFDDGLVDGDAAQDSSVLIVDPQSFEEQGDANSNSPIAPTAADVADVASAQQPQVGGPEQHAVRDDDAAHAEQHGCGDAVETAAALPSTPDVAAASCDWINEKLLSLRHYVDARCDRLHVALLDTEQQAKECVDATRSATEAVNASMQASLDKKAADLEAGFVALNQATNEDAQRALADAYDSLAGAVRDADNRLQESFQQAVSRVETELTFLVNQLSDRVAQLSDNATAMSTSIGNDIAALRGEVKVLDAKLSHAVTMELLPPTAPLPTEGTRLRLVIAVDCPQSNAASTTVLLPVSDAATVGMLKREVLRRAVQQSIIPAAMHTSFVFSKTVVILDGIALFEEDTLSDVGIVANDKLVIRSTETNAVVVGHNAVSDTIAESPTPITIATTAATVTGTVDVRSETLATSAAAPEQLAAIEHIFLHPDAATNLDDQESMDRRLTAELARMEIEPLKREEQLRRVVILKAAADKVRITLLDRATYSHDDLERRVARSALEKLNDALAAGTSPNSIVEATLAGRNALSALRSNAGEDDRVQVLQQAAATERNRKERTLEDLKDLIFTLRHRLRIPADLYGAAEHLLFSADRAILLAPSTTVKELDSIHKEFAEFVDKLRSS